MATGETCSSLAPSRSVEHERVTQKPGECFRETSQQRGQPDEVGSRLCGLVEVRLCRGWCIFSSTVADRTTWGRKDLFWFPVSALGRASAIAMERKQREDMQEGVWAIHSTHQHAR